jgi:hypothetical protein
MSRHDAQLIFIQAPWLEENAIRNPDLAHVMKFCGQAKSRQVL